MVRRLKVYFIHSTKMDFLNKVYRPIVSSSVCIRHELMLPHSKAYEGKYIKDLMMDADIIVAEVSDPNFSLKLELKWAIEANKPVKYISLNNILSPRLETLVPSIDKITPEKPMIKIIEDFISHYASMTKEQQNDTTIILGDL